MKNNISIFNRGFKTKFNQTKYAHVNDLVTEGYHFFNHFSVTQRIFGSLLFGIGASFFLFFNYNYGHDFHINFGHVEFQTANSKVYNYLNNEELKLNKKVIERKIEEDKVNDFLNSLNFEFKINK